MQIGHCHQAILNHLTGHDHFVLPRLLEGGSKSLFLLQPENRVTPSLLWMYWFSGTHFTQGCKCTVELSDRRRTLLQAYRIYRLYSYIGSGLGKFRIFPSFFFRGKRFLQKGILFSLLISEGRLRRRPGPFVMRTGAAGWRGAFFELGRNLTGEGSARCCSERWPGPGSWSLPM
jgi:hypothetical protein